MSYATTLQTCIGALVMSDEIITKIILQKYNLKVFKYENHTFVSLKYLRVLIVIHSEKGILIILKRNDQSLFLMFDFSATL